MGYRRPRKTIRLVFEDEALAGLEVRARSISVGKVLGLMSLADSMRGRTQEAVGLTEDMARGTDELFHAFAAALESWNLEDEDGEPVPATYDGLMSQDLDFAMDLVLAWLGGVVSTPGPLEQRSNGGAPSPDGANAELSIPMEPLSASPGP